jgi:hypothetical protein
MNKKTRREKMKTKKILGIILMASFLSWGSVISATDSDSQIASAVSTFTLTSYTPPARNLNLTYQPQTHLDIQPQNTPINPEIPQVVFRESGLSKVESALYTTSLVSLLALNVADYFSTREALKHEGLSEGNPLMKPFVKNDLTFAAVKIGLTIGNHIFMKSLHRKNKTLAWVLSIASNFAMSYIVANNLKMIGSVQTQ